MFASQRLLSQRQFESFRETQKSNSECFRAQACRLRQGQPTNAPKAHRFRKSAPNYRTKTSNIFATKSTRTIFPLTYWKSMPNPQQRITLQLPHAFIAAVRETYLPVHAPVQKLKGSHLCVELDVTSNRARTCRNEKSFLMI
jgi:hypothetical protein